MNYAVYDSQGRILSIHASSFNVYVMAEGETFNDATHYMLAGIPTPRPTLDVPATLTMPCDGEDHEVATFPFGTKIAVNDVGQGQTNGSPTTFAPTSPGTIVLGVTPPFPYRPITITITVTELEP
jgi:hypothetical protein